MQARELKMLIEAAGKDFVGACLDSGNPLWTLEDPHLTLETLAPYVLTSHVRDTAVWRTPEGAAVAWVRMGEGNVDIAGYVRKYARALPGTRPLARSHRHRPAHVSVSRSQVLGCLPQHAGVGVRPLRGYRRSRHAAPSAAASRQGAGDRTRAQDLEASIAYTKQLLATLG